MGRPLRDFPTPNTVYHVICRGNNRQEIFLDHRDYFRYLELWRKYRGELDFDVYAYVLMPNHVHWLLKTGTTPLPEIIHRMHSTYARWFNHRHERTGHLFQGRYKSFVCDTDSYLLVLARYIHLNPVRAGLVQDVHHYPWSSFPVYCGREDGFLNTSFLLEYYGRDMDKARQKFISFTLEGIGRKEKLADIHPGTGKSPKVPAQESRPDGASAKKQRHLGPSRQCQKEKRQHVPSSDDLGLCNIEMSKNSINESINMHEIAEWVKKKTGVDLAQMRSNSKQGHVVLARDLFIKIAVGEAGIKRSRVAEFLNKHRSLVTRTMDKLSTGDAGDVPPRDR